MPAYEYSYGLINLLQISYKEFITPAYPNKSFWQFCATSEKREKEVVA
jgi:hypothetical protein